MTDIFDDIYIEGFDLESLISVKSRKPKKSSTEITDFSDSIILDDNGDIDIGSLSLFLNKPKKKGKPRVHRNITIVLNERKPGGYDVWVNPEFSVRGGRKINLHGMETLESASKMAVELYSKIQYNQDTHKRKKSITCDIVQIWEEAENCPIERKKRPTYIVPEWETTISVTRTIDGKRVTENKTERVCELKYEVVDGVTKVKIPPLLKLWFGMVKRRSRVVSKNGFIPTAALSAHAKLFWRGMSMNELGQMLAKRLKRKWSSRFAYSFIKACNRLHKSVRVNLALQSIIVEKLGVTKLPSLGELTVPSEIDRDSERVKTVSEFTFNYPKFNRPNVDKFAVTCNSDGDLVEYISEDGHFWEFDKRTEFSTLLAFKKSMIQSISEVVNKFEFREVRLHELTPGQKFEFCDAYYLYVGTNGNTSTIIVDGKIKLVPDTITVIAKMRRK